MNAPTAYGAGATLL